LQEETSRNKNAMRKAAIPTCNPSCSGLQVGIRKTFIKTGNIRAIK
jgi:hypothetical protein